MHDHHAQETDCEVSCGTCNGFQALSSYISIAVNVVLFTSSAALQLDHLRQVLPAIFPFMMTGDLRTNAFTQVREHIAQSSENQKATADMTNSFLWTVSSQSIPNSVWLFS